MVLAQRVERPAGLHHRQRTGPAPHRDSGVAFLAFRGRVQAVANLAVQRVCDQAGRQEVDDRGEGVDRVGRRLRQQHHQLMKAPHAVVDVRQRRSGKKSSQRTIVDGRDQCLASFVEFIEAGAAPWRHVGVVQLQRQMGGSLQQPGPRVRTPVAVEQLVDVHPDRVDPGHHLGKSDAGQANAERAGAELDQHAGVEQDAGVVSAVDIGHESSNVSVSGA